jgi:MFS family permease
LAGVLGAPPAVIGLIEGVAEATASLMKTVSGRWSDLARRRKPFVLWGYSLSALSKPLLGVATGWPLVLGARVLDRFGKGVRTSARDALLADSVAPEYRGRAFGWHRAMDTAGAVVGPLLALAWLHLWGGNLRSVFLLAFIPAALGALIVLTVREPPHAAGEPAPVAKLTWRALPPAFRAYLIGWTVFAVANSSDVFLILRVNQLLGHAGEPPSAATLAPVIWLYALYNVVYAVASPGLGNLSDRIGRTKVLTGGLLVFALVYLGFAGATSVAQLWPLFAVYGLYTAATDGVGKALAVDLVPKADRAAAVGLLGTVTGVATLLASVGAGALWSAVGPWAAFAYGAAGAALGALLLSRIAEPPRPAPAA